VGSVSSNMIYIAWGPNLGTHLVGNFKLPDGVNDCFQWFSVGCLIAESRSVDGKFNRNKVT